MIFLYGDLYIIWSLGICEHSIFFQLLNRNMFNGTLKISFFIDGENLLIFKFRNSKFYLQNNFVNNYKFECLQIFKFLPFKMIWNSSFEKNYLGGQILSKVWFLLKNGVISVFFTLVNYHGFLYFLIIFFRCFFVSKNCLEFSFSTKNNM